ncbi:MAG: transglutaminase-like domain-containing protein [Ignavibacteriaceae bacterium]|nr:transglutaminase-like domain-containing protein [Ignavibacteriaceae bacterium]
MKKIISKILVVMFMTTMIYAQSIPDEIQKEIEGGWYTKAQKMITEYVETNKLSDSEKEALLFESERLERIRKDFTKTHQEIIYEFDTMLPGFLLENEVMQELYLRGGRIIHPLFNELKQYEKEKSLEMKIIDDRWRYYKNAIPNLFRINKKLRKLKEERFGLPVDRLGDFKKAIVPVIVAESKAAQKKLVYEENFKIIYTLNVKPNAVPAGEIVKCWLPYPKEIHQRQQRLKLISTSEEKFITAPDTVLQRTIYMEKKAEKDSVTKFSIEYELTAFAEYNDIFSKGTVPEADAKLSEYVKERPPHIVFTDEIKTLSQKIIGDETKPLEKVKKIFSWIDENIPWASALEYSTIPNISAYCLENLHGDCGIKTLLFMTLCRYNGIPAKWQSGWMLHPVEVNLHDWCEIYIYPFGWVPVDQSFGLINSENEKEKYFYIGNTDPYHLIINDDYSQPLFPVKIFPRSETVDFQRGEVEWRGGNLYFDKWNYDMVVSYSRRKNNEK